MNEMTDKQMEVILNLVADKFAGCKDMDEVQKAIDEVRNMAKKEKPIDVSIQYRRMRADIIYIQPFGKYSIDK